MNTFVAMLVVGMTIASVYAFWLDFRFKQQRRACDRVLTAARDERLLDDYDWDMIIWRRRVARWLRSGTRLPSPYSRPNPDDYEDDVAGAMP